MEEPDFFGNIRFSDKKVNLYHKRGVMYVMVKELATVAPSKRYQAWRTYFDKILNNMIDADPGIEDECEILEFNEGKKNHRV